MRWVFYHRKSDVGGGGVETHSFLELGETLASGGILGNDTSGKAEHNKAAHDGEVDLLASPANLFEAETGVLVVDLVKVEQHLLGVLGEVVRVLDGVVGLPVFGGAWAYGTKDGGLSALVGGPGGLGCLHMSLTLGHPLGEIFNFSNAGVGSVDVSLTTGHLDVGAHMGTGTSVELLKGISQVGSQGSATQ